jgi:hypothetical protein
VSTNITLSTDFPELERPLMAAMSVWNDVSCGPTKLVFSSQSSNQVSLQLKHNWRFGAEILAMTTRSSAGIKIEINRGDFSWTELDYQNILVHELGHVLGLAHSEQLDSVMHPIGQLGYFEFRLSKDDKKTFCALEPVQMQPKTGCAQMSHSPEFGLFTFVLVLLVYNRHRISTFSKEL